MEFQSLQQKLQRGPCCYYSNESRATQITPRVFVYLHPRSLAEVRAGERGFDRQIRAAAIAGGESGGAWEVQQAEAHLWVAWEVEGRTGAMASTASSGWRSSATAADWFQWGLGEEEGWVSFAETRQS